MGCIYKITNTVNGKAYIGKSVDDSAYLRIYKHFNGQGSKLIYAAIKKYGENALTYEILHDCIIPELLDTFEIEAIKTYNTITPHGYNICSGGEGGTMSQEFKQRMSENLKTNPSQRVIEGRKRRAEKMKGRPPWNKGKKGVQKHSAQTRREMSKSRKGEKSHQFGKTLSVEHRQKIREANRGRKHSAETRRKRSESLKGNKNRVGHKHSEEFYQKRSKTYLGMSQEAFTILVDWLLQDGWSQNKIARELRTSRRSIRKYSTLLS